MLMFWTFKCSLMWICCLVWLGHELKLLLKNWAFFHNYFTDDCERMLNFLKVAIVNHEAKEDNMLFES